MIKKIILLALIAGIAYLNYTNPSEDDHRTLLLAELQKSGPVSAELQEKIFRDVDFSNFMVCSAMKSIEDSKMISLGYLKKVKGVNDQWALNIRKKYRASSDY